MSTSRTVILAAVIGIVGTLGAAGLGGTLATDAIDRQLDHQRTSEDRARTRDVYQEFTTASLKYLIGFQQEFYATAAGDQEALVEIVRNQRMATDETVTALAKMAMSGTRRALDLAAEANRAFSDMLTARSAAGTPTEVQRLVRAKFENGCKALTTFVVEVRKQLDEPLEDPPACIPAW